MENAACSTGGAGHDRGFCTATGHRRALMSVTPASCVIILTHPADSSSMFGAKIIISRLQCRRGSCSATGDNNASLHPQLPQVPSWLSGCCALPCRYQGSQARAQEAALSKRLTAVESEVCAI
jgi:hypothetical protein